MNQQIAQRWSALARSGKYQKARGLLQVDERTCFLGLLCILAAEDEVVKIEPLYRWESECNVFLFDGEMYHPPKSLEVWAGLKNRHFLIPQRISARRTTDEFSSFAGINDCTELTLSDMADLLDEYWEIL